MRPAATPRFRPADQLLLRQRAGVEELLHQRVVRLGDHLDERFARGLRRVRQVGRNRRFRRLAAAIGGEGPGLHRDEIDDAAERFLLADRAAGSGSPMRPNTPRSDSSERSRLARSRSRRFSTMSRGSCELLGGRPDLLGRDFDAGDRVDDDQRGIGHAQRRARVAQEVRHPGRVDEIDFGLVPLGVGEAGGRGCACGRFLLRRSRSPWCHRPRVRTG